MKLDGLAAGNIENKYQEWGAGEGSGSSTYVKGQILEGTVTKAGEQVTLDFSGKSLNFPSASVPKAAVGQLRRFEVTGVSESGVTLRELGAAQKTDGAKSIFTQVDTAPQAVLTEETGEQTEEETKPEEITERMTEEDYLDIAREGYTLEGFNLRRLEHVLERIKAGRIEKQENLEGQQQKKTQHRKEVEKMVKSVVGNLPAVSEYLTDLLVQADIPVTKSKLQDMMQAVEHGSEAISGGISSSAQAYLIGNELSPEIENIYRAEYSGTGRVQEVSDEVWRELENSAAGIMKEAGIEVNAESMEDARWLVEHELPLTAENLLYKAELDTIGQEMTEQDLFAEAVEALKAGKSAQQALLGKGAAAILQEQQAAQSQQDFAAILPETVDLAVERLSQQAADSTQGESEMQELTLRFLQNLQKEMQQTGAGTAIQAVTARRQLEEIRLKLTTEAGMRLLGKGISLDTSDLSRLVEGLRQLEQEYYQQLYQEAGTAAAENSEVQIDILAQTQSTIDSLKGVPAYVLGETFSRRFDQTIVSLETAGRSMAANLTQAGESYEALMTKPRADMGDSIQKAFRQMDSLLTEMGQELTDANRRAVKILSYNSMELTEENMTAMKLYDAQVNDLFNNMNPAACTAMIKKGINPLEMPITQLNEMLTGLREEEGASTVEKFSSFLVKLDQKKELSAEERESYIGIYRLLHQVAKSDGAAIGAVAGAGQQMTLENLLTAVRTRRKGGVDAAINDESGIAAAGSRETASITDQVNAAFTYQQLLSRQILDEVTPEKLSQVEEHTGVPPEKMNLEQLQQELRQASAEAEEYHYAQEKLAAMTYTAADSAEEQAFLSAFQAEHSMSALQAAKELMSSRSVRNSLENLAHKYHTGLPKDELSPEQLVNAEKMQEQVEKWSESADKAIDDMFEVDTLTGEDSLRLITLRNTVQLTRGLAQREFYEIPLRQESGFVKLNLTVVHSGEMAGVVSIQMKGETDEVAFELRMDGKKLNCFVSSASRPELEQLQQKEETIKQSLKEQGFETTQWNYGLMTRSAEEVRTYGGTAAVQNLQKPETESAQTRTDDLYLAAKTVIQAAVS